MRNSNATDVLKALTAFEEDEEELHTTSNRSDDPPATVYDHETVVSEVTYVSSGGLFRGPLYQMPVAANLHLPEDEEVARIFKDKDNNSDNNNNNNNNNTIAENDGETESGSISIKKAAPTKTRNEEVQTGILKKESLLNSMATNHSAKKQNGDADVVAEADALAVGLYASSEPQQRPGAYAFGGTEATDDGDAESGNRNRNDNATTTRTQEPTATVQDDALAVADPVLDESLPNLQHAQGIAASSFEGKTKIKILIGFILLLVVIVAVTVVVAIVSSKDSSDDPDTQTEAPYLSSTTSKTIAPTSTRENILSILSSEDTLEAIMEDSNSPQAKAFQWLMEETDSDNNGVLRLSTERVIQRFALATLFFSTRGNAWLHNTNWLDHEIHECDWFNTQDFGLQEDFIALFGDGYLTQMFPLDEAAPPACNRYGLYQHLWLNQIDVNGPLPLEIYWLTSLQTLSLGLNRLEGTFSSHLGQLTNLEGLMTFNMVSAGTIPTELGQLSKLRALGLGVSNHQGTIPSELWKLTNLEYIFFGYNYELRGSIPSEIGLLSNMRFLTMGYCDLTGVIPTEIGLLQEMEWILLEGNSLTGTIPSEIGGLPKLNVLSVFDNSLAGSMPIELSYLTSLNWFFWLQWNQLTGALPSEFGLLSQMELVFDLRDNFLSGTIPSEIGQLTLITELNLSGNQFSGEIPSELGQMSSWLGSLLLANNTLSGLIPTELSSLETSLHTLSLEGNPNLSGSVPENLCFVNGTCYGHSLTSCIVSNKPTFDCTSLLCGCDCECNEPGDNGGESLNGTLLL